MTVSSFAFAEKRIEPTFNSHFLITEEQHNQLEAKYQDLIHEVITSLSGPRMHQQDIVKATSESVAYKYMPCNSEISEKKEICERTRYKLASALSHDVSVSKEYEPIFWTSKKEYYKDSIIGSFLMEPNKVSVEKLKVMVDKQKTEREEDNKTLKNSIILIGAILLAIPAIALLASIIINVLINLWIYALQANIYIRYRHLGKDESENKDKDKDEEESEVDDEQDRNQENEISFIAKTKCLTIQILGFIISGTILVASSYFFFFTNTVEHFMREYPGVCFVFGLLAIALGIGGLIVKAIQETNED